MKTVGVVIRKVIISEQGKVRLPTIKNIKKQLLTLHRKIKKKDEIKTEYIIEKDDKKGKYHTHLIIHYNDENNLYNQLNRFIGGSTWISENSGFDEVKMNNGKWGEVRIHNLYDIDRFKKYYMDKYNPSETYY